MRGYTAEIIAMHNSHGSRSGKSKRQSTANAVRSDEVQLKRLLTHVLLPHQQDTTTNKTARKPICRLARLPDEVLCKILERVESTLNFQLTCRAFRKKVLQMPTLWTHVTIAKNPEYSIQRSKGCGLHIHLEFTTTDNNNLSRMMRASRVATRASDCEYIPIFLLLLEPHYLRWTELIIIGDFKNKNLSLAVEELNKRVQHRAFPMLKRLVYTVKPDSWPEGWNAAQSALAPQILVTTWDLPSLEILELRNYIPTQIKGSPTIFRLSLLDDTGGAYWGEWDVNALTTLLQSFDQLVELDLCFSSSCFTELDYNLYAELPQLMKLNITLLSVQNTDILHAFSAPALKELSVRCEQFDQMLISRVAEALFPATMCR